MKSRILIVEDESIEAMDFKHYLESFGYDVVGISSAGKDAIEKVAVLRPDLVLMDVVLNGEMDGIEAAAIIKDDFDIPVIYLTAHSEESTVERAKLTIPYGYLIKPVDKTDLNNFIEFALYKHQLESESKESEKKYRSWFEDDLTGNFIATREGKIIECNPAFADIYGIGGCEQAIKYDISQFNPTDWKHLVNRLKTEHKIQYHHSTHQRPDGKKIQIIANFVAEHNETGQITEIKGYIFDDTKRKIAENAIQEREEFFSGTLNDLTTLVAILKLDGEIIFVNNTSLKLIEKNLEDVKGMMFYDVEWWTFSKETVQKLKEHIKICASGETVEYETQIQTLHGLIWIDYSMHPFFDEEKKLKYLVAEGRNINQHKKSEKKLERSEKRYQSIFENSGTGLLTFGKDGTIIMMNSEWEKLSGYSHEELEGKRKWMEFVHPDYLKMMMEYHQQREKDPESVPLQYETVFIIKSGKQLVTYITVTPIPESDQWLVSAIDITDLKNTQKKLEKSVVRFQALAEYSVDGIITTDAYGKILYFNNSLLNMFGYSKEELKNSQLTLIMPERYRENFMNSLRKFRLTGEHRLAGRIIETIGHKKDDTEFPFEMSLTKWEVDKKIYFTSIIRNISERKTAENDLKKSLKEKEILLKEIHHRVKNNLQIISSLLDLQEDYVKEDTEAVNVLKESQNRVLSMAMLHEMLYQSKDLNHINFSDYTWNLVSNLLDSYVKPNIQTVINVEEMFLNIETSIPLGLIISELVSNSLKYAFPHSDNGKISIDLHPQKNGYELIISDNGIGIPETINFKNNTLTLGLRLVNNLVDQLDGTIDLNRTHGTKYTIKFQELKYNKRI